LQFKPELFDFRRSNQIPVEGVAGGAILNDVVDNPVQINEAATPEDITEEAESTSVYSSTFFWDHEAHCVEAPRSFQEAMASKHKQEWTEAMTDEINTLRDRQVYEEVTPPSTAKIVGSRWVYTTKKMLMELLFAIGRAL